MARILLTITLFIVLTGTLFFTSRYAPISNANEQLPADVAIYGYDTVAYFTLKRATAGSSDYQYRWDSKTWLFSTARHRDLFASNPEQYVPQFSGFCANGLSDGHAVKADPENWRVINGKLYLFFSQYGKEQWSGKVKPLIESATTTYHEHAGK